MDRIPRYELPKEKRRDADERKKNIDDENIGIFRWKTWESDETKQIRKPTNIKRIGRLIRGKSISWLVPLNLNFPLVKDPR